VKFRNWKILLGISLVVLSAFVYFLHYAIFHDLHHIFIFLFGDLAFVFIEVLLVTLVIHGLLEEREKKTRLKKVNMVIGAFFSEVGATLLEKLAAKDPGMPSWQQNLAEEKQSPKKGLETLGGYLSRHNYSTAFETRQWEDLKEFLVKKREFMLRLLENPNLLEHESFTDLLWAVFHLTDELGFRKSFDTLPDSDYKHLYADVSRVYSQLALQWLEHMEHLRVRYPYLFSLALRTNPFNQSASPIVTE
jgi:hypothetical protein